MFNVCWECGIYRADKIIDPDGPAAVCPECGHRHPFRQLPLFLVSGASGAGKSTVCQDLLGRFDEAVLLDADILWRREYDTPADHYRSFFETWLRVCKNIGQSGRPVVLFGAGTGVPENLEACIERRYLGKLHYMALVCEDDVLVERLRRRPEWRGCATPEYLKAQTEFNQWFRSQADIPGSPIEMLDTTRAVSSDTAGKVAAWIRSKLGEES